jgi:hypothetical protein
VAEQQRELLHERVMQHPQAQQVWHDFLSAA